MRFLFGMYLLVTSPLWASTFIETQIHDIDHGDHITDDALVFLSNGRVLKINVNQTTLLNRLNRALLTQDLVILETGENREILSIPAIKKIPHRRLKIVTSVFSGDPLEGYTPSVLTEKFARQIFREARSASREETQCFNRAMIWTYEWRVKHNVFSKKVWLFFTRKYIRRYNFEWWFHVSPLINMVVDGQIKERTLDRKYSSGPMPIQKWANIFLRDDAKCPFVQSYADHSSYPEAGSCFIQKSPMYYYQPVDLEYFDKYGTIRDRWVEADVRAAYAEAFDIYP